MIRRKGVGLMGVDLSFSELLDDDYYYFTDGQKDYMRDFLDEAAYLHDQFGDECPVFFGEGDDFDMWLEEVRAVFGF